MAGFHRAGVLLGLGIITLVVFLPALRNGFVQWDDYYNLVENPHYRGLGWSEVRWMLTTSRHGHYIPLTWLSFGLDYVLWGMNPVGYHLTSVLLHVVAALIFFLVAEHLLGCAVAAPVPATRTGAAAATLLFALHPLRAESVAWVTERRGVLSGVLFLLTVWLYLSACRSTGQRRRWLLAGSVGAYVLAFAAKSTVMALPLVLVLLDVYPLRRLGANPSTWLHGASRGVLVEKVPYAVLGLAGAALSYAVLSYGVPFREAPWAARLANVPLSLMFYGVKSLVPFRLSPLYEAPARIEPLAWPFLVAGLGVVLVSIVLLWLRRRWPAGLATWIYYCLMVAPVSGIVPTGIHLVADRYSYLSCLGWAILAGGGLSWALAGTSRGRLSPPVAPLVLGVAAVLLLVLGGLTWRQVQIWRDTGQLWRHAVTATPRCSWCHLNLGNWLFARGAVHAAHAHFERALALRPEVSRIRVNLAQALVALGRVDEAIAQYELVLARHPAALGVRLDLGVALLRVGRLQETVEVLRAGLRHAGPEAALAFFEGAVAVDPAAAVPRAGLLQAYLALGRTAPAEEQHERLRRLHPDLAAVLSEAPASSPRTGKDP